GPELPIVEYDSFLGEWFKPIAAMNLSTQFQGPIALPNVVRSCHYCNNVASYLTTVREFFPEPRVDLPVFIGHSVGAARLLGGLNLSIPRRRMSSIIS